MPVHKRTIEYFTCQFKCGASAKPLLTMQRHEARCFCNPETKSCRICTHYNVGAYSVACYVLKLMIYNDNKNIVFDESGDIVFDGQKELMKSRTSLMGVFYEPTPRPFPKSDCKYFELGKKAY